LRRASGKTGDRSNSEGDGGKSSCAVAKSAVSPAKSFGAVAVAERARDNSPCDRDKTDGAGSNSVGDARQTEGDAGSDRVHEGNVSHDRDKSGGHAD